MTNEEKAFIEANKAFTTSDLTKAGLSKRSVRKIKGIVELGTFPTRFGRNERHYTYDPELKRMVRYATKIAAKANQDPEVVQRLVDRIESKVRSVLGYEEQKGNENE
jgi:hypothetical protein